MPAPTANPGPAANAPAHTTALGSTAIPIRAIKMPPTIPVWSPSARLTAREKCATSEPVTRRAPATSMTATPAKAPAAAARSRTGNRASRRRVRPAPRRIPAPPRASPNARAASVGRTTPALTSPPRATPAAVKTTKPYTAASAAPPRATSRSEATAECRPAQRPPRYTNPAAENTAPSGTMVIVATGVCRLAPLASSQARTPARTPPPNEPVSAENQAATEHARQTMSPTAATTPPAKAPESCTVRPGVAALGGTRRMGRDIRSVIASHRLPRTADGRRLTRRRSAPDCCS